MIRPDAKEIPSPPLVLQLDGLPDLRLRRQPQSGAEAAAAAIAYADAIGRGVHHERTARAAYLALIAHDAADLISRYPQTVTAPSYGIGLADLRARLEGLSSCVDTALSEKTL